jgi:uncharacterized membrane protein YcjF (UPF0283 family)
MAKKIHLGKNLLTILGIVLVWRGVWYILDWVDDLFWNGDHTWTAVVGVAVGLLILYIPDKDLKEIEKL